MITVATWQSQGTLDVLVISGHFLLLSNVIERSRIYSGHENSQEYPGYLLSVLGYQMGVLGYLMCVLGYRIGVLGF